MANRVLVTGAARCGKSEWAETIARQSGLAVIYVATAQIDETDREWQNRIQQHQQRRPADWETRHIPIALADVIAEATPDRCLLIDSLGTWLANRLDEDEATWQKTIDQLLSALIQTSAQIIIVAEETGWGVVPAYPIGRSFRDRLGSLTRAIAQISDPVYLVVAGYALNLNTLGTPIP